MFQNDRSRSPHLSGRALRGLAACTVLALVGCGDSSMGPAQPGAITELPEISAAMVATNTGVADNFHFLPPIAQEPEFTGTFDPMASPEVVICVLDGDECESPPLETFTTAPGSGSETIRVDEDEEHYIVNWHSARGRGRADYRISVSVGGNELGYADVTVKRGRTLPIKFWIEVADAGDVCTATTGAFDDLDTVSVDGAIINLDATTGQIGFAGWEYGSRSADWLMFPLSTSADPDDHPVVFARTSSDIAAFANGCSFTIYADHFRGGAENLNWAGGQGWFANGAVMASPNTTTGVIVVFRAAPGRKADIFLERYDDSGMLVERDTIATALDFPPSSGRRLGADVSADGLTVVVWTVLGEADSTIYGAVQLSAAIRDANHRRGSLVAGLGTGGGRNFTGNFTVEPEALD